MNRRRVLSATLCAVMALGPACPVLAHGRFPDDVPIERLITNLTKYIAEHPTDADGYYRLGRVYTLALESKGAKVLAFDDRRVPGSLQPAEGSWAKRGEVLPPEKQVPEKELVAYLTGAITNLNKAIELAPGAARYRLTLACALEAGLPLRTKVAVHPMCPREQSPPLSETERSQIHSYTRSFNEAEAHPESFQSVLGEFTSAYASGAVRDAIVTLAFKSKTGGLKEAAEKVLEADWKAQSADQFFTAFAMTIPQDGKQAELPIWGGLEDWVSYEAAQGFLRVIKDRGEKPSDIVRVKIAKATIKAFEELPRPSAITPILLDLENRGAMSLLLQKGLTSEFDLDGTGRKQRFEWVAPTTGILCWDPDGNGKITSGRQLFGTASWWVMFGNGYQALDLLDDNRDGLLSGAELTGICLWCDANGNGLSDPGEVRPVTAAGVTSLSCRATGMSNGSPANSKGVTMSDGRELASYDWTTTALSGTLVARGKNLESARR